MIITHRLTAYVSAEQAAALRTLGIEATLGTNTLVLREDQPEWPSARALLPDAADVVTTTFANEELLQASVLRIEALWHWSYPQPEKGRGYLNATYDLTDYCSTCGAGLNQARPFLLKAAPRWGRREALALNWVFDELFVTADCWEGAFAPHGIGGRPVLGVASGRALPQIVQLEIPSIAPAPLQLDGCAKTTCEKCGRDKYLPPTRGFFPQLAGGVRFSGLCRSREMFGDGASAFRAILVSGALAAALKNKLPNGLHLTPLLEA